MGLGGHRARRESGRAVTGPGRLSLAAALATVLTWGPGQAGYRELEVLFVNMTPDGESGPSSRQCVAALEKQVRADDTKVTRIGETPLRKLASRTAGEPFLDWPGAALEPARRRGDSSFDAIILIDCRPDRQRLDVLVAPASPGLARLQVRGAPLDATTLTFIGDALLRRAWSGFVP
jgi:hypothetical protein